MSREAWLAARDRAGDDYLVGGSDLGAIMGVDPYRTALDVWAAKKGIARDDGDDDVRQAGHFLEDGILRWYAAKTGRDVRTGADMLDVFCWSGVDVLEHAAIHYRDRDGRVILRSRRYPWLAASLDALVGDRELGWGVLDAKNTHMGERKAWVERSPLHYRCQLAGYRLVTGLPWAGFAVLFGGRALGWADEPGDDALEAELLRRSQDFVTSLHDDRPPTGDASGRDLGALRAVWPKSANVAHFPTTLVLDGARVRPADFDEAWLEACAGMDRWGSRRRDLEAQLRVLMRDARELVSPTGSRYVRTDADRIRRVEKL